MRVWIAAWCTDYIYTGLHDSEKICSVMSSPFFPFALSHKSSSTLRIYHSNYQLSVTLAERAGVKSAPLNDDLELLLAHHLALWMLIQSNEIKWNHINPSIWVSSPSIHVMTPCWTVTAANMLLKEHDRYVSFNLIDLLRPFMTFQWILNKSASWNGSEPIVFTLSLS